MTEVVDLVIYESLLDSAAREAAAAAPPGLEDIFAGSARRFEAGNIALALADFDMVRRAIEARRLALTWFSPTATPLEVSRNNGSTYPERSVEHLVGLTLKVSVTEPYQVGIYARDIITALDLANNRKASFWRGVLYAAQDIDSIYRVKNNDPGPLLRFRRDQGTLS